MKKSILVTGMICIASMSIPADPTAGQVYRINLINVDGNSVSTADGRISTLVLVGKSNVDKAREVGDRIPNFCLGNPLYRMLTVVAFESKHSRPVRAFLTSMVRRRVDSEAKRLQARYDQLKIARNARDDVFAMADFDGAIAAQLDAKPSMS